MCPISGQFKIINPSSVTLGRLLNLSVPMTSSSLPHRPAAGCQRFHVVNELGRRSGLQKTLSKWSDVIITVINVIVVHISAGIISTLCIQS